jgi:uncharacterized protein (TIGR02246 family)
MSSDEADIRALIQRWHEATALGDVDAVLALMSEDVEFFVAGKQSMKGRAAFAAGLRGLLKTHRIVSSGDVREVQVSGDLAFAVSLLHVRIIATDAGGEDVGGESVRSGHALSVFRRQADGSWLLIRDANLLPSA